MIWTWRILTLIGSLVAIILGIIFLIRYKGRGDSAMPFIAIISVVNAFLFTLSTVLRQFDILFFLNNSTSVLNNWSLMVRLTFLTSVLLYYADLLKINGSKFDIELTLKRISELIRRE